MADYNGPGTRSGTVGKEPRPNVPDCLCSQLAADGLRLYDATPEPLSVEIHAADTTYSYRLAAYNSDLFWLNFLSLGIGMFEDRGNNNRYEHPDLYWTGDGYRTFRKNDWTLGVRPRYRSVLKATERRGGRRATRYANSFQKGRVNVSLAFPWLQLYSFSPVSTGIRRNNGGCIGIAAGIEYLYRDKRGIALETSALAGYATIWGPAASIDPPPNEEWSAIHISLAEYFHFRRFTVGYGLNAARNKYTYKPPYPGFRNELPGRYAPRRPVLGGRHHGGRLHQHHAQNHVRSHLSSHLLPIRHYKTVEIRTQRHAGPEVLPLPEMTSACLRAAARREQRKPVTATATQPETTKAGRKSLFFRPAFGHVPEERHAPAPQCRTTPTDVTRRR